MNRYDNGRGPLGGRGSSSAEGRPLAATLLDDHRTAFRIRRTLPTVGGRTANVDPLVSRHLEDLDHRLGRRVFPPDRKVATDLLEDLLDRPITPRRSKALGAVGEHDENSLLSRLQAQRENAGERSLSEFLDGDNELTDLRYAFQEELNSRWSTLDYNTRAVLERPTVRDLVMAQARRNGIGKLASLMSFALTHPQGAQSFIRYISASAARSLVVEDNRRVTGINLDDHPALVAAMETPPKFSVDSFAPTMRTLLDHAIDDSRWDKIIKDSKVGEIPPGIRPILVRYLNESTIPVTPENAPFMVPVYLAKAATSAASAGPSGPADPFAVTFYGDDAAQQSVNTAAVRCAAQLFYVMTLGDELGVFDTVRYLTQDYLFRDGFAIEDPVLRKDLEDYVFSNRFLYHDPRTGTDDKADATREPVRKAYYRQVFDHGNAPTIADTPPNSEFKRLWKILMLESARFLERAQLSPHPDNYVSRQNVMQAVEDLQYNLSTTCVGLATVATPMINAELDFVVTRILNHPEVRRHLVPTGGSWLKLVEKMAAARGQRTKATILNNKARIGHELLTSVAEYSAAAFEQDEPFSRFISSLDAFITTSSILEEFDQQNPYQAAGNAAGIPDMQGVPGMPGIQDLPGMPGMDTFAGNSPAGATAPAGDWDF